MKTLVIPMLSVGLALSPPPLQADLSIETSKLALTFDGQGRLIKAAACHPDCQHESARRLELQDVDGIISFGQDPAVAWVQRRGLAGEHDNNDRQLHFSNRRGQSVTWTIPPDDYRIRAQVANAGTLVMRAGAGIWPKPATGFGSWLEHVRYVAVGTEGAEQTNLDQQEPGSVVADWAGFRNRFWAVLASGYEEETFTLQTGTKNTDAVLRRNDDLEEEKFVFYVGPVDPAELIAIDPLLGKLSYTGLWFWLRWICFGLYYLLGWIQSFVPSWGMAIILLSAAVNILMLPLSRLADRVQQQVHATEARLEPELSSIKKTWRGEEQAARILALYKSEGISPLYSLKSMLGLAIVIPVFIAAFDMLAENINLLNTGFLWIDDLSRPDAMMQLPFKLPFFGSDLNALPFLMTYFSVVAAVLHRPSAANEEMHARQVRNMSLLALAFFALFYTFPAGMVLYWTSNNLISVGKGLWARRTAAKKA